MNKIESVMFYWNIVGKACDAAAVWSNAFTETITENETLAINGGRPVAGFLARDEWMEAQRAKQEPLGKPPACGPHLMTP